MTAHLLQIVVGPVKDATLVVHGLATHPDPAGDSPSQFPSVPGPWPHPPRPS